MSKYTLFCTGASAVANYWLACKFTVCKVDSLTNKIYLRITESPSQIYLNFFSFYFQSIAGRIILCLL
jgi:hypothetical protein